METRIKSFDGVPLDVNVALPAVGDRFPLVIQVGAWGSSKPNLSAMKEWALAGYATLSYTPRGFGNSCGAVASRIADPEGCARGWTHLGDSRYEARDAQHLAGRLADDGIVLPHRIGVTGGSYGGAVSLQLATLRDSVQMLNGHIAPWRSPQRRLAMSIAAAAPIGGWSDFLYSLLPNGRSLDYTVARPEDSAAPFGVLKGSLWTWFYDGGAIAGYYAPPGEDPSADIQAWNGFFTAGEPYDPVTAWQIAQELRTYHGPAYVPGNASPSPLFISGGFTDDLVPADEVIRFVNRFPDAVVAQFHADVGHPRAQRKAPDLALRSSMIHAWFDRYVKGDMTVPAPAGVTALTQTCPKTEPSGGPFTAPNWASLHPGEVRFADDRTERIQSTVDSLGAVFDPMSSTVTACTTSLSTTQNGVATYELPQAEGAGFTLLGSPTVIADLTVTGHAAADSTQLAARLWDVGPTGQQTLVARGLYRPTADGRAVFQLHPNAWHFAANHHPKLELLGRDSQYARLSNFTFSVNVRNLELRIPVAETPDSQQIDVPLAPVLPPGSTPAP